MQESRSFTQMRASPFSVFRFDLEIPSAWYSRGIPPDQAWQSYQASLQTLVRRRCVHGYPGRIFYCCIQRNKWSFHLRWQVPPNLVLCPAAAGKGLFIFYEVGGAGGDLGGSPKRERHWRGGHLKKIREKVGHVKCYLYWRGGSWEEI